MSKKSDIPTGKFSRVKKITKTAAKLTGKHVLYSISQPFRHPDDKNKQKQVHQQNMAQDMFKTLATLKGSALKAAQLVSLEFDLLPPDMQKELKKSYCEVPPLNRALVRQVIKNQLNQFPEMLFDQFDSTAFAAASIGQVHYATIENSRAVAVKIQYPGIGDTIQQDIEILKLLLLKMPIPLIQSKSIMIKTYLNELELRFSEETDYQKEGAYLKWFKDHNPFDDIVIPDVYKDYCGKTVLTMDYLDGIHIHDWLDTNPSQTEKNRIGQLLWNFFSYFFIHHHRLHADPNPGNFMVLKDGRLAVLDFGCAKLCDPEFPTQIQQLIGHHINENMDHVMDIYSQWGILPDHLSNHPEQVEQYILGFRAWITKPFRNKSFDFKKHPNHMKERFRPEFKEALHIFHNPSHNFLMFDRTFMGLLNIFSALKANIRFHFD